MSCESCVSCQAQCNSCNMPCQVCNSCNTSQTLCSLYGQLATNNIGQFSWGRNICAYGENDNNNSLFLSTSEWNSLIDHIYEAYCEGDLVNAWGTSQDGDKTAFCQYNYKDIRAGEEYNNIFMSANMYNGAISKMRYLTSGNGTPGNYQKTGGTNGDIITASAFNALKEYANMTFKLNSLQCDRCNVTCQTCVTSCNVMCNGCNGCNSNATTCTDDE